MSAYNNGEASSTMDDDDDYNSLIYNWMMAPPNVSTSQKRAFLEERLNEHRQKLIAPHHEKIDEVNATLARLEKAIDDKVSKVNAETEELLQQINKMFRDDDSGPLVDGTLAPSTVDVDSSSLVDGTLATATVDDISDAATIVDGIPDAGMSSIGNADTADDDIPNIDSFGFETINGGWDELIKGERNNRPMRFVFRRKENFCRRFLLLLLQRLTQFLTTSTRRSAGVRWPTTTRRKRC